jgi:hypothetical protein
VTNRDVALIAFRTLALWVIVWGVTQSLELLLTWDQTTAQMRVQLREANAPPPHTLMLWGLAAFLGRAGVGVLLWAGARPLAWLAFPREAQIGVSQPLALYRSVTFLVALWLLAQALPTTGYYVMWGVKTGWRPGDNPEGASQVAELLVKLLLGVALLRGDWFIRAVYPGLSTTAEQRGVEQMDAADERRGQGTDAARS